MRKGQRDGDKKEIKEENNKEVMTNFRMKKRRMKMERYDSN